VPLHTADCERTFSIQNQILTTKCNRLSPEISDKLIRVKIHGKGLKEENFQGILEKWQKKTVRKLKSKT
jgi:23S rRNA pseudoU1915 N3-methylase RlmH